MSSLFPLHEPRLTLTLHHSSPEALPVEALEEGVVEEVGDRGGDVERVGRGGLRRGEGSATTRTGTATSARG